MPATWKTLCDCVPQRWIIVVMSFLALFNSYTMRLCLSIAITKMVKPINQTTVYLGDTCPKLDQETSLSNETIVKNGTFDWDEKTQGLILSSSYWGYVVTSLAGGLILDKIESKHTMGLSVLFISILTLITPVTVEWGGWTWLIVLRVLVGLGEGAVHPSVMRLMAHWTPEDERSLAAAWVFSGMSVGTIVGMAGTGTIIQRSTVGWPAAFYFFGALGVLCYLIHCCLCYDSPREHPFISDAERNYLRVKLEHTHKNLPPTPWRHVISSKPIWALQIAIVGEAWTLFTLISDLPKYMNSVLKFSVEANGYVTSIPFFCSWIFSCVASWIADLVIAKKIKSIARVRKISNSICTIGVGLFLVIATYVGCNRFVVIALQTVAMMLFGCSNFGMLVNVLDLAPNYAGTIQGITFGISTIVSLLSPYVTGFLTPNQTISEWRYVFWLLFAICALSNLVFVIFGSGEVQGWNEPRFLTRNGNKSETKEDATLMLIYDVTKPFRLPIE